MSATSARRRIAVVTGTRAEFGLLKSIMHATQSHAGLELHVVATGAHFLPPHHSIGEIKAEFEVTFSFPMQTESALSTEGLAATTQATRLRESVAVAAGVAGMTQYLTRYAPDIVLVLGDRIEAFAATAAAAVAGVRVAHMHGGDRAEGVADESLRHAISKLAHIHFPATQNSALRLIAMGEEPQRVHVVGSPAMDGIDAIPPLDDESFRKLGSPRIVVLHHPQGDDNEVEYERALQLLRAAQSLGSTLALHPNHDAGRDGIMRAIAECVPADRSIAHLPREKFIGLLRRAHVLVGNSSAGLIEAAAIPIHVINVGARQAGRETPNNVATLEKWDYQTFSSMLSDILSTPQLAAAQVQHPYGDGNTGPRTAELLATIDMKVHSLRKRNAY